MATHPIAGRIAAVSKRQHGLVTAAQLVELGVSVRQIEGWRANQRLERVLPGVFRVAGTPTSRDQQFAAAALWGGPRALISHRAGGEVWGFRRAARSQA
jgi:hypothetical protein